MEKYSKELQQYNLLNKVSEKGGIVFFTDTHICTQPICELARDYGIEMPIYNRSIEGLCIDDVDYVVDTCVASLKPKKVFVGIGETDISNKEINIDEFISKYEWLLYTIHTKCNCSIYIMSVMCEDDQTEAINKRLKKLSTDLKCEYIDTQSIIRYPDRELKFFDKVRLYLRSHPITFTEAMRTTN